MVLLIATTRHDRLILLDSKLWPIYQPIFLNYFENGSVCEKREDEIQRLGEFDRYRIRTLESNFNNFPIVSWEDDRNISCPLEGTLRVLREFFNSRRYQEWTFFYHPPLFPLINIYSKYFLYFCAIRNFYTYKFPTNT